MFRSFLHRTLLCGLLVSPVLVESVTAEDGLLGEGVALGEVSLAQQLDIDPLRPGEDSLAWFRDAFQRRVKATFKANGDRGSSFARQASLTICGHLGGQTPLSWRGLEAELKDYRTRYEDLFSEAHAEAVRTLFGQVTEVGLVQDPLLLERGEYRYSVGLYEGELLGSLSGLAEGLPESTAEEARKKKKVGLLLDDLREEVGRKAVGTSGKAWGERLGASGLFTAKELETLRSSTLDARQFYFPDGRKPELEAPGPRPARDGVEAYGREIVALADRAYREALGSSEDLREIEALRTLRLVIQRRTESEMASTEANFLRQFTLLVQEDIAIPEATRGRLVAEAAARHEQIFPGGSGLVDWAPYAKRMANMHEKLFRLARERFVPEASVSASSASGWARHEAGEAIVAGISDQVEVDMECGRVTTDGQLVERWRALIDARGLADGEAMTRFLEDATAYRRSHFYGAGEGARSIVARSRAGGRFLGEALDVSTRDAIERIEARQAEANLARDTSRVEAFNELIEGLRKGSISPAEALGKAGLASAKNGQEERRLRKSVRRVPKF